jgi:hypothetical protein
LHGRVKGFLRTEWGDRIPDFAEKGSVANKNEAISRRRITGKAAMKIKKSNPRLQTGEKEVHIKYLSFRGPAEEIPHFGKSAVCAGILSGVDGE